MKAPKTSKQGKLDAANNELAHQREACRAEFADEILVQHSRNPQRLAEALSRQHPSMRVMVIHQNGEQVIAAAPGPVRSFEFTPGHGTGADHILRQAYDAVKRGYPSLADVRSFAEGFAAAAPDYENMKELRAENARLKDRQPRNVPPMMMNAGRVR